jgi:hypothetical protein
MMTKQTCRDLVLEQTYLVKTVRTYLIQHVTTIHLLKVFFLLVEQYPVE